MRLLKFTAAAVVFASAFADAAQANLGLTGSQGAPVAPLSSVVTGVSTTVTGTLDAATAPADAALGDAQATAAQGASTLDATVDGTVGQVQSTLDTTVDDTLGPVQTTLDGTVDDTLSAGETVDRITAMTSSVGGSVEQQTAPLTWTLGQAGSSTFSPIPPVVANVSPAAPATRASASGPTVGTASSPAGFASVGLPPTSRADSPSLATPRPNRAQRDTTVVPLGFDPALATPDSESSVSRTTPVPRLPGQAPSIPIEPLSALLQGPDAGGLPVTGALLGLIALLLAGGIGLRLRPVADLSRPSDVFFRLERPG